ncbi:g11643 [Coccomyxa elongata]
MFNVLVSTQLSAAALLGRRCALPHRQCFRQLRALASTAVPAAEEQAGTQDRKVGVSKTQDSKGLVDVQPVRGTRDFGPEDYRLRQWLFDEFEAVSRLFGFEQFETPVLESEELFVRKAGEEITQQLYNFEDKGGRRVALRPELTPSLARLVLAQAGKLSFPAKWFAIGQCWRYERTTRGRRREHFQWNMDIIGVPGIAAEAELLAAIVLFLERVGLSSEDIVIKVSSRKVLQAILERYNVPEESVGPVSVVVDKMEKIPLDKVEEELAALGLSAEASSGIIEATRVGSLAELEGLLGVGNEAVLELQQLFSLAEGYGFADYLQLDTSCVRGLAYYTGMVFEGRDRAGQLRAIFGGGRYDRLLSTFGGEERPCAGFGFGDCVIVELLRDKGLLPSPPHEVEDLVVVMDEALRGHAAGIAQRLRRAGRRVDLVLESKKMKWVFKQAERCGAKRLVLVAPDEWEQGLVRVKNQATREETNIPVEQLVDV